MADFPLPPGSTIGMVGAGQLGRMLALAAARLGFDVVTLDPDSALIVRVDGFFGHPTPIDDGDSGVPPALRAAPDVT